MAEKTRVGESPSHLADVVDPADHRTAAPWHIEDGDGAVRGPYEAVLDQGAVEERTYHLARIVDSIAERPRAAGATATGRVEGAEGPISVANIPVEALGATVPNSPRDCAA